MSLPFENALQRERERQRRQREGGQHTDLSARMDTPAPSQTGVGSLSAPPPPLDINSMTDMVTELTRRFDPTRLNQEIEDFNLTFPMNVDDALNLFSLPPVAGVGTAPATTITKSVTNATQTRPVTSTQTRPVTTTTTSRPRPVTSTRTHPATTATTTAPASRTPCTRSSTCRSRDVHHHHLDDDHALRTSQNRCQATATTSRCPFFPFFPLFRFIPSPV